MKVPRILIAISLLVAGQAALAAAPALDTPDQVRAYFLQRFRAQDKVLSLYKVQTLQSCPYKEQDGVYSCTEKPRSKEFVSLTNYEGETNEVGKRESKKLHFMTSQADQGTGTLTHEYRDEARDQEMWIYLPTLKKTKRMISASDGDQPNPSTLFGSEFNTEDTEDHSLLDYEYTLVRSEVLDGRDCWVFQKKPTEVRLKKSLYSNHLIWVDKELGHNVQRLKFNRQGQPYKLFSYKWQRNRMGTWTETVTQVRNLIDKRMSEIVVSAFDVNVQVDASAFNQRALTDAVYRDAVLKKIESLRGQPVASLN